ncbi:Glycosyltransferase involved in cell wall bisynthesis [Geoalkalibacter ferrihydriticus]|uniref:Glycosyltransferase subfamily 4-like N-terminal domain-containing protein n=2 Tax=Geoalkalibacter ferrihydriticus TaxID=392333 RepID=A0A0C2HK63_9BACT|nr:glycosyltransferase family 4 protein [Geoalkalibacter ferrihydriticus]KIH75415.1 hypothetical protein GFER_16640 [Geoalkalibacter ferrihydriticus DSM 17813]SDM92015.1 Glycosyltransferase involved in cell wall bisynthesis [Geoalkalibacter ferrihydriticus]
MKIVYISSSAIPSRAANSIHVMKMCQAFAKNGHEVVLLAPDRKAEYEPSVGDCYEYYGVEKCFEIVKIPWLPLKGRGYIYGFLAARKAKELSPDLVYCRNAPGCYFAARFGQPVFFESHAPLEDAGKISDWMFRKIIKDPNLQKLVVITNALKDYYEKNYPATRNKIQVAPDGADPIPPDIEPVVFPNAGKRLQVGYVGHLYRGRGIEHIASLALACREWADFHVVGGGQDDLARCISEFSYIDNLYFHGFLPYVDAQNFRVGCDVLIAPYQEDISIAGLGKGNTLQWMSPLKIFEYMAAGKPIICTNFPVLREVLVDKKNALLCHFCSQVEWIEALASIRDDSFLGKSLGENAYSDFIKKYTWGSRAQRLMSQPDKSLS